MTSIYGKPSTLSQFKSIPAKYRQGKKPSELLDLHNSRIYHPRIKTYSLMKFINSDYNNHFRPRNCITIKIGSNRVDYLSKLYDPKKKNYTNHNEAIFKRSNLKTNSHGRYSSSCRYNRFSYTIQVQSFGYLINKNTMYFKTDTDQGIISRTIKAPRGFHFAIDHLGFKIQSNSIKSMDYHFTAIDLLPYAIKKNDYKSGQLMVAIAKSNYKARKQVDLKSDIFSPDPKKVNRVIREAERLKVQISIVDSIKAGNCLSGTQVWAMRNHMKTNTHYQIQAISDKLDDANKDRVKLVILRAIERTKQELARGYSLLQDHYLEYQTN
jgi:hypothetical protein